MARNRELLGHERWTRTSYAARAGSPAQLEITCECGEILVFEEGLFIDHDVDCGELMREHWDDLGLAYEEDD